MCDSNDFISERDNSYDYEEQPFNTLSTMNGINRNSSNSRNELYRKALETLARSDKTKRFLAPSTHNNPNLSHASSEDRTIDLQLQCNFNPSEITGRSTACVDTSMSVEQILSDSKCTEVRALADELKEFKIRESGQLALTADVSMASFRSSMSRPDDWGRVDQHNLNVDDGMFVEQDKVAEFLRKEEDLWAKECGSLQSNLIEADLDEDSKSGNFSKFRLSNELSKSDSVSSIGQFFAKRSDDLRYMLLTESPKKIGKPTALLDSLNSTVAEETEKILFENPINASKLQQPTASNQEPISISRIQSFYKKCNSDDSARAIGTKLMDQINMPSNLNENGQSFTKQLPLQQQESNSNVNILKIEKLAGEIQNVRILPLDSQESLKRSTILTPSRQHIIKNAFDNKENHKVSKTLQTGNTDDTLSKEKNDVLHLDNVKLPDQPLNNSSTSKNDITQARTNSKVVESESQSNDDDVTPINTPVRSRSRKRIRSADRAMVSPETSPVYTKIQGFLNRPRQHNTVAATNAVSRTNSTATVFSTPERKKNLAVLYNPKHRLPSPVGLTYSNVTGAQSEFNLKSPKLLRQCNSQFSSVSDLREFLIKSSHSVLSWPSQKLRKPSVRQFTIKNLGGKKLTVKLEVIGPGFQLSPTEPSQLIQLHAQECRTISVTFCPTILGPAVGKLNFCHAKDSADRCARKIIPLYGYGGHTMLDVQGVCQGVVGNPFLQLGTTIDLLTKEYLAGTFSIYNKGPLRGVAIIRIKSDYKKPVDGSSNVKLQIKPTKSVIEEDSHVSIDVTYRPKRNDIRKLLRQEGNVISVATLEIFLADEPSRQRLLILINKFANNLSDINLLEDLFRGVENTRIEDLRDFHETEETIADLFNQMKSTEVVLTIKRSILDETIEIEHNLFSDSNDSLQFHTLVDDELKMTLMPQPSCVTLVTPSNSTNTTTMHRNNVRSSEYYVEPNEIYFNSTCLIQRLAIHNDSNRRLFDTASNYEDFFLFEPDCGVLMPNSTKELFVKLKRRNCQPKEPIWIKILIDKKSETIVPVRFN